MDAYYKIMPFGLKNASMTYKCLVNKMFVEQIRRNMKVYVNDMLVNSLETSRHLSDLEEVFSILRKHKMRLNPTKCAFGVSPSKFSGYMVNSRGIEANPNKICAVLGMATLTRFILRATNKALLFLKF